MVIIEQLRISDDGKRLYINAHVNQASYFDDIYIDNVTIMTSDKVSETAPGTPTEDYIYKYDAEDNQKRVDLVLTVTDFIRYWETDPNAMSFNQADMLKTLFFVYIKCKGTPSDCTPCTLDEETTLGVTFDENLLYQKVMDYTKQLADDCTIPKGFTDFILQWNAFKAAVETEHYIPAIKYFNQLFGEGSGVNSSIIKGCGCHG